MLELLAGGVYPTSRHGAGGGGGPRSTHHEGGLDSTSTDPNGKLIWHLAYVWRSSLASVSVTERTSGKWWRSSVQWWTSPLHRSGCNASLCPPLRTVPMSPCVWPGVLVMRLMSWGRVGVSWAWLVGVAWPGWMGGTVRYGGRAPVDELFQHLLARHGQTSAFSGRTAVFTFD